MSFKTYLQKLGNGEGTIRQKLNYTIYFFNWQESEHLQIETVRYNDLLNFIDYSKLEGKSIKYINSTLRAIRNYYDYLKQSNPDLTNPAGNLYLKGTRHKLPAGIIDYKELELIYEAYPNGTNREKRNKVILGLLIYQGLTTEELHRLKAEYLKLKEGKILVPGNHRRNSRTLELKPFQILELYEYVNEVKPSIIREIGKVSPSRKPNQINKDRINEQLFISINGSENIKNSLLHLFKEIRKKYPEVKNAKQIRSSVIVYRLKNFNLRQVQYFAGHKYVSSTERYQLNNLESLKSKLKKYHPLS
ncbi:site-specific integrase [Seonamhaeicola sp.]|uniref:tyrosine-type recombinase/integrase n=1 Tax=Seonamhaeicola sp. TaxID=1912245 RepID=UPI00262CB0DC|nr:site-specific integrase [Seonamhaeicola sp.]